jgi:predicted ATPase
MVQTASLRCQVIVATQSTDLVRQFKAEDIITVDRDDRTKETIFKRWNSQELAGWLEDYSIADLWEKNIIGGR